MDISKVRLKQAYKEDRMIQRALDERQKQQSQKIDHMEKDHDVQLTRLMEVHEKEKTDLERAFQLELEKKSENFTNRLRELEDSYSKIIEDKKKDQEESFEKLREAGNKRIFSYKEAQDERIEKLKEEYALAAEEMAAQYQEEDY